jgi:peptide/nickel transport system substrate-binding protein
MRTRIALAALLVGAVLVAGCGTSGDEEASPTTGGQTQIEATVGPSETGSQATPPAGGIYRIGVESSFNFTNAFDPTGEYLFEAWALYSSLLVRTLLGYDHVAGPAGNELIPDLAAALPEVSADGRAWTFRLKDGVRFGPPVSREITSEDVRYAFERIGTPSLAAQYGYYYDVIEGMEAFRAGKASSIEGIETPDEKTIVFHLAEPTGDFGYRLAMPATGPIPAEVAGCFDEAGTYGRYLIASGPYMIEGSEALDASSCESMVPISGFDPETSLSLVRNPDYDRATDSPEAREALPDGFLLTINSNASDILAKIRIGELDGEWSSIPPKVLREYATDPDLEERLKVDPADAISYVMMNLTQAPFDDVHVRRAVNLALDKQGLQLAWGGPLRGEIATHVLPDSLLQNELEGYDPYATEDSAGDPEAARSELRQSRYDTDGDGRCDASVCEGVLLLSAPVEQLKAMEPIFKASLGELGIDLTVRQVNDPFVPLTTPGKDIPISGAPSWGKDYADASTFMPLFDGSTIIPRGNVNMSLVGLTPATAKEVGASGTVEGIPSVDGQIERCRVLQGAPRTECYAALDRHLMEEVVPWAPYLERTNVDVIGPAVTAWAYDQFSTNTSYAHVAVDPSKQTG